MTADSGWLSSDFQFSMPVSLDGDKVVGGGGWIDSGFTTASFGGQICKGINGAMNAFEKMVAEVTDCSVTKTPNCAFKPPTTTSDPTPFLKGGP